MSDIPAAVRHARRGVRLAEIDPRSTPGFTGDKAAGEALLAERAEHLAELQERLHASASAGDGRSVLLLLQGMDTAGKGGLVRHVVGAVDPQGVRITSFKRPTPAERRHDFLWRIERALPQPGQIGVFDRSHYEDVLIHRVRGLSKPEVIEQRYGRIVDFERQLADQGVHLVKVMPHISYGEQGARLLERLDRPDKHWKYNPGDVDERTMWAEYQQAYTIAIDRTARVAAPWHVVPADRKWFARLAVQELLIEALEAIDPQWPVADYDVDAERERLVALGGIPEEALAASPALAAPVVAKGAKRAKAKDAKSKSKAAPKSKSTAKSTSKTESKAKAAPKSKAKPKGKGKR
ncbi:polyphosphate:nucleotide phosphotransferase, PPK2 family [Agrococcus jejuensis]|uniref:Polyphosphate:nucleotide phosphotransferase, PPK2 family n=1 Tax=Agrococcus jejuensis TaxID=399736 RepID=A0A1G8EXD4_9MICO|nr:polyphosphate:nucleotide phosphotransferase, PPK2 family [Agrococcus jejuensis]